MPPGRWWGGGSLYITPHKQSDVHTFATSVLLIQGVFSRTVSTTFISHTVSSWTFCWVKKRLFLLHEEAPWLKCCISNEQRFKEKAEFHVVNRIERFALSAGYVFSTFYCNNASIFLLFLPRKTRSSPLHGGNPGHCANSRCQSCVVTSTVGACNNYHRESVSD